MGGGASLETFSGEAQLKKSPCILKTNIIRIHIRVIFQTEYYSFFLKLNTAGISL